MTHPVRTVVEAHHLIGSGLPDADVAARLSLPTATVRNWRRGRIPARARVVLSGVALCDRCLEPAHRFDRLPAAEYAQFLGLYLGDGCLARLRSTYELRIAMDTAYPKVIAEAVRVVQAVLPGRAVGAYPVRDERWVNVTACSPAWPCLLPQHGPGKKHHRPIRLEPWQKAILDAAPGLFLRGLIHSDGWRGENRVHVKGRDYAYPRYQFSNRSADIRMLFTDTCDRLGVAWRPWGRWHISVARREAVALLDEWVGPKS